MKGDSHEALQGLGPKSKVASGSQNAISKDGTGFGYDIDPAENGNSPEGVNCRKTFAGPKSVA